MHNREWKLKHLGHLEFSRDGARAEADRCRVLAKHTPWGTGKRLELLIERRGWLAQAWRHRGYIRELKKELGL